MTVVADMRGQAEIVKFWAPWCGSCRLFAPVVSSVVDGSAGEMRLREVNLAEDTEEADARGVGTLPTLVVLKDGKELGRLIGAMSRTALTDQLSELLGGADPSIDTATAKD
ncbi:MAG: hypothetical protein J0J05_16375 [Microbacterium sp.]|uniref:thioredoxin family protein n=1 Tax=Microbacterium sp. TaxID=51671 RepID=UPI001AC79573|nr:thioredoxin domain-containing protein [Microbacterium sp.]MBN9155558.1 hypothetical protein [Microbacterium sp.]